MIPISLYVSMEVAKLTQTWVIESDPEMFDEERQIATKAKTSSLNEELGQIEFIFSDKTGNAHLKIAKSRKYFWSYFTDPKHKWKQ